MHYHHHASTNALHTGNASGKAMEYFDAATSIKYVPHVIEPSIGVDR